VTQAKTYCYWAVHILYIPFFDKDLSSFEAEILDLLLGYRLAASQLLDLPAFQEMRRRRPGSEMDLISDTPNRSSKHRATH
jgi:hypothetical protein